MVIKKNEETNGNTVNEISGCVLEKVTKVEKVGGIRGGTARGTARRVVESFGDALENLEDLFFLGEKTLRSLRDVFVIKVGLGDELLKDVCEHVCVLSRRRSIRGENEVWGSR